MIYLCIPQYKIFTSSFRFEKIDMGQRRKRFIVSKQSKLGDDKKRAKIQAHFWSEVGAVEHISLPRLKDAIRKELNLNEDRQVQAQVDLMQTEQRIRIESKVKIWIKQPQMRYSRST